MTDIRERKSELKDIMAGNTPIKIIRTLAIALMFGVIQYSLHAKTQRQIHPKDCPPIALVKRQHFDRPFGIGSMIGWDIYKPGGGIYVFDPKHPEKEPREIFRRDDGVVFDMSASFDAKKLLFAWKKCKQDNRNDGFHIFEINADGTGLRQITNGPYNDIHPFYLPDGKIAFVSTRSCDYVLCQPGAGCALHVMNPDGSNIQRIHFGTLADHSPFLLDNGSILFTRWEYQDKDLTYLQGLWTLNPDGTRIQLFYGNTILEPAVIWQAKTIPNTSKVLCTLAPHHGNPVGAVGIIDRKLGLENPIAIKNLTPEFDYNPKRNARGPGDRQYMWAYRDPWPIHENLFVVSYGDSRKKRYGLFLMDARGTKRLLYEDSKLSCFNALPLKPRKKPLTHNPVTESIQEYGAFFVADIYQGMVGVKRGQVKAIRVMKVIPKTCNMRGQRAYDMDPLMGRGTYYAKYCLGTVPVDENGSAYFKAPAREELYFQALDADGKELCRMGSITQLMPGETQGCIGCHESRFTTPVNKAMYSRVLKDGPVDITPPAWGAGPVDFVSQVQPVLDKYCADCHSSAAPDGGIDLSSDKTRFFNMAYDNLTEKRLVNYAWLLNEALVRAYVPLESGSRVSRLAELIEQEHAGVKMDDQSRRRIYTWIEANVPYYGTFDHTRPGTAGSRDACQGTKWFQDFSKVYSSRCASCHGKEFYTKNSGKHHTWINLTNPQFSKVLNAPLAKSAGGLGTCKTKKQFKDRTDKEFQLMLAAIEKGKKELYDRPRMDMPHAVPEPFPQDLVGPFTGFAGP